MSVKMKLSLPTLSLSLSLTQKHTTGFNPQNHIYTLMLFKNADTFSLLGLHLDMAIVLLNKLAGWLLINC